MTSQTTPPVILPPPVEMLMDKNINRLRHLPVHPDPIVPKSHLRAYGVITSAVRSDGRLLEMAFVEALKAVPHLTVLRTPSIFIPGAVDQFISGSVSHEALLQSDLHYTHGIGRKISPDVLILDAARKAIDIFELKRGLAKTDAGKTRQTVRDLRCVRLISKSYAQVMLDTTVVETTAAVCSIHGASAVPPDLRISLEELEARYNVNLKSVIEHTYLEFGRRLEALLFEQALEDDLPNLMASFELIEPASVSVY
ncbi:hypothetical protein [Niveispirillum lacus]|nr:hypothetical protein [Niveispirillum lacus]